MQLRPAIASDSFALSALGMKVWLNTYAPKGLTDEIGRYVFSKFSPEGMKQILESTGYEVHMCTHGQHVVGYAVVKFESPCPSQAALDTELSTLYVDENFKQIGVGSALLAATKLFTVIPAWLRVNSKNTAALAFYRRHGLQRIGSVWVILDGERNENYLFSATNA